MNGINLETEIDASRLIAKRRRGQLLKEAGGRHSSQDIKDILTLQKNRCIYCNTKFSDKVPWSKDHLLPVNYGGGNHAINIVLSCRRCNYSRGDIPFFTYCKLLTPTRFMRVKGHVIGRLTATDFKNLTDLEAESLYVGLVLDDPKHWRYLDLSCRKKHKNAIGRLLLHADPKIRKSARDLFKTQKALYLNMIRLGRNSALAKFGQR